MRIEYAELAFFGSPNDEVTPEIASGSNFRWRDLIAEPDDEPASRKLGEHVGSLAAVGGRFKTNALSSHVFELS